MHSYPNPSPHEKDLSFLAMAILDHMGKESLSSPWNAKLSFPRGRIYAFFLEVHPSPASPKYSTNPLQSTCREGFFPLQKANPTPHKSFPKNTLLYLYFSVHFYLSILFSFFYILFFKMISFKVYFLFSFFPKLWILPQSGKIIPQHLGWIIE